MSELRNVLSAWIAQANSPIGKIPDSTDPADWVADRFLEWWEPQTRDAIEGAETALAELRDQANAMASNDMPCEMLDAFETLAEEIRAIRAAFLRAN